MPVDYSEVIKDLDAQEKQLMEELAVVRAARPAIFQLKAKQDLAAGVKLPSRRFAGMGATKAIPLVLADAPHAFTTGEIVTVLKEGGWTTNAQSAVGTVSATLAQLKNVVRVGEGWSLKTGDDDDEDNEDTNAASSYSAPPVNYADQGITDGDIPF